MIFVLTFHDDRFFLWLWSLISLSNEKTHGWLGYLGYYTTDLYEGYDYKKPF